jgi:hypothetical protein
MYARTGEKPRGSNDATIRRGPEPGTLTVGVKRRTPETAKTVVDELATQLAAATRRQLALVATQDAQELRVRLATHPPVATRRELRARLRRVEQLPKLPPARVAVASASSEQSLDRWTDSVADILPGEFPGRPDPWWAGLAGLFVAAALWALGGVLFPPCYGCTRATAGVSDHRHLERG